MKYTNMEKLKAYLVTRSCSDGSIIAGDLIWISLNGDLNSVLGAGVLMEEEWDCTGTNDFEVEESDQYYIEVGKGYEKIRKRW